MSHNFNLKIKAPDRNFSVTGVRRPFVYARPFPVALNGPAVFWFRSSF